MNIKPVIFVEAIEDGFLITLPNSKERIYKRYSTVKRYATNNNYTLFYR
jgi:hypothetical protein